MGRSAKIREQLLGSFRAELAEHVQIMTDGLLALEQGRVPTEERAAALEPTFRAAHSLKGAARALNVVAVEQLAHSLENALDALRRGVLEPTAGFFGACYGALDAIQAVHAAYEAGDVTPPLQALAALTNLEAVRNGRADAMAMAAPAMPSSTTAIGTEETIRVSVAKLDELLAQASELLVLKLRAADLAGQVREVQESLGQWNKSWAEVDRVYHDLVREQDGPPGQKAAAMSPVEATPITTGIEVRTNWPVPAGRDAWQPAQEREQRQPSVWNRGAMHDTRVQRLLSYVEATQQQARHTSLLMDDLARRYTSDLAQISVTIDAMAEEIKRTRMLPLSTITAPLPRMVRDLAQAAGKVVRLEITGSDTELDRQILEKIKDPLIHLLRNAVDHGVEPPAARQAAHKPDTGLITLAAERRGQEVAIIVADDGAGLDLEAIRAALDKQGRANVQALSQADLESRLFEPGVTTSTIVTDISGRGIGLNVVQRNIQDLRGRIDLAWSAGHGTRFTLFLPLTLTSLRALIVTAAGEQFAIPLAAIDRLVAIRPADIQRVEGRPVIALNGHAVPLVRLADVLQLGCTAAPATRVFEPAVVTSGDRPVALIVDELADEQEIVVKGLGKQLLRVSGIAGATVIGNNKVVLILDPSDLVPVHDRSSAQPALPAPAAEPPAAGTKAVHHILVVDDSITTRTLEKNILEAAGYRVTVATDGEEAWAALGSELPHLVVSDILMPRLDGFELTRRIKSQERTVHLPVILVSSLESAEDKASGIQAGADAYIVKSRFDQGDLLETIEQLIS